MVVFLFGVAAGWVFTFIFWFAWSFSIASSLLLGALIGTTTIFAFLAAQWMLWAWSKGQHYGDVTAERNMHPVPKKAISRP